MTTKMEKLIFVREENEAEFEVVRATGSSRKKEEKEEEMNDSDDETLFLCFCVPGNPGVPEYYSNFTSALREALLTKGGGGGKNFVVECVGFLGHYADGSLTRSGTR